MAQPTRAPANPAAEKVAAQAEMDRSAILAELEQGAAGGETPAAAAAPQDDEPEPSEPPTPEPEPAEEGEAPPAPPPEGEPEPAAAAPPKPADDAPDPHLAKRLDAIQKAEKRAKEAVAREREAFEKERAEWSPLVKEAQDFRALKARAKYDPAGALAALGLTDDDMEPAAKQVFARSKAGQKDPKLRETSDRELRQREYEDKLTVLQREHDELKAERERERTAAVNAQKLGEYLDSVTASAGDETPIVRTLLTKNQQAARERLHAVAEYLYEKTGEVPDPGDVVKELEKVERAELEARGIDPALITKKPNGTSNGADTKTNTPAAGEKRTAKTLTNDLGTPTQPRSAPQSREDLFAEMARELEQGRLE